MLDAKQEDISDSILLNAADNNAQTAVPQSSTAAASSSSSHDSALPLVADPAAGPSAIQNKLLNITTTTAAARTTDSDSKSANVEESIRLIDDLKYFLATAPANWQPNQIIRRYYLNHEEGFVSCIFWNNLYFITGTDIVKCLIYRFQLFGRTIIDRKKFEEGIFSDLRNLKCGTDAILEPPKSPFLEFLYKNSCLRTQKKQKVFFWFSVQHDKLFADALERDFKREMSDQKTSTKSDRDPALSFKYDDSKSLFDQLESHMIDQKKALGTFDNNNSNNNNSTINNSNANNPNNNNGTYNNNNINLSLNQDDSLKNFVPSEDDFPLDFLPPNNDSLDPFSNTGASTVPNSDLFPLFGNDISLNSTGMPITPAANNLLTINNTAANPSANNQIPFLDPNIFINPMLSLNPALALQQQQQQQQQMALPNLALNPLFANNSASNNIANFDDFLLSQSELFSPSSATAPPQQDSSDMKDNKNNNNVNTTQQQQQQANAVAAAAAASAAAAQNFSSFLNPMVGGLYNPLVLAAAMQQQQKSQGAAITGASDFLTGNASAGMDFTNVGGIPSVPGANMPQISNGLFYDQQQQQQLLGNLLGGAAATGAAGTAPGVSTTTAAAMAAAASPVGGLFPFNMNNLLGNNIANNVMGIPQSAIQGQGMQLSMDEINQLQRQRLQQQSAASVRMMKLRQQQQQAAVGKVIKPGHVNISSSTTNTNSNENASVGDQNSGASNVDLQSNENNNGGTSSGDGSGGNSTTAVDSNANPGNNNGDWTTEIGEGFGDIFSGSGSENNDK